jgi:hypothetical protein
MFKAIPTYHDENGNKVEFFPVNELPGFTHRVVINGVFAKDYLGDHCAPSAKVAKFYFEKHNRKAA